MRLSRSRPMGRFIFWWVVFLATMAMPGLRAEASTSKTLIQDVMYRADGTPAQGTLLISWPEFTTAGGDAVAAGSMTVTLGQDGSVSAALFPNSGSNPQGTYYKVMLVLGNAAPSTEYWVVPQVAQTTIGAVRSQLVPQSQAMQFVGRDYVDSAVSAALASAKNLASPGPIGATTPNTIQGTTITGTTVNMVADACVFVGGDAGAKINVADAVFTGTPVEIDVNQACGSWTTPIALSANHTLKFTQPGSYTLPVGNTLAGHNVISGLGGPATTLQAAVSSTVGNIFTVNGPAVFQDLVLDGNLSNQTHDVTGVAVSAGVSYVRLTHADLHNWRGGGVLGNGTNASPIGTLVLDHSDVATTGSNDAIFFSDVDNFVAESNTFAGCGTTGAADCIGWELTATRHTLRLVNNYCKGASTGHCFAQGSNNPTQAYGACEIVGNTLDNAAGNAGISPQCLSGVVANNHWLNGPAAGGNHRNGLEFYGSETSIVDNHIQGGSMLVSLVGAVPSLNMQIAGNSISNGSSTATNSTDCFLLLGGYPGLVNVNLSNNICDLHLGANSGAGIHLGLAQEGQVLFAQKWTVKNNLISISGGTFGILAQQCNFSDWVVEGNKISGGGVGLSINNECNNAITGWHVNNNDLSGVTGTPINDSSTGNTITYNQNLLPSGYVSDSTTAAAVLAGLGGVPTGALPQPSNSAPLMNGAAAAGSSTSYARADHIHPTDASRAAAGANNDITSLAALTSCGSLRPCKVAGISATGQTASYSNSAFYTSPNDGVTHHYALYYGETNYVAGVGSGSMAFTALYNNGHQNAWGNYFAASFPVTSLTDTAHAQNQIGVEAFPLAPNTTMQVQTVGSGTITTWPTYDVWFTLVMLD